MQHDIREAPLNIRDSYKMYYKLKTNQLAKTLGDVLEDDDFDLSLLESSSQLDSSLSTSLLGIQTPDVTQLTSDDSAILTNHSTTIVSPVEIVISASQPIPLAKSVSSMNFDACITEFEAEKLDSFNENAWGRELNRTKSIPNERPDDSKAKANNSAGSLRKTMSDKLFRNSSFVKRNPRKSLSRTSLTGSQLSLGSGNSSQRETLPDLETILSQKSMQMKECDINASQDPLIDQSVVASGMNVGCKTNSNLINSIDYDWLNRCNQNNTLNESDTLPTTSQSMPTTNSTYGLSNINANVLQTLEPTPLSIQMKFNVSKTTTNSAIDDDDEEIANSEDESMNNSNTVQIRSIRNKRKHSEIDKPTAIVAKTDDNANGTNATVKKDKETRTSVKRKARKAKRVAKTPIAPQPMVTRRSTRTHTTKKQYAEIPFADDSDRENAEDPFAGDDSDADPDFGEELMKKKTNNSDDETTTSETGGPIVETKNKTKKEKKTMKTAMKVVRKRVVAKQPSIKPDPVRKGRRVAATRKKISVEDENVNDVSEESPDDYLMEFGIDNVQSVPRIAADELAKITKRFTGYVHNNVALQVETTAALKKPIASSSKPLTTKNSVAKDKLEKRIAAGTVNENFVRINIRKKVFVRGKKTVNFSRYKKQQWRNKKAAALTGPEMDMRGCDGGLLMCFQCGLPGHFAQNCKVKSKLITSVPM